MNELQWRIVASAILLAAIPLSSSARSPDPVSAITFIDVIPDQFVPNNEEKAQDLLRVMNADTQKEPGLVSFVILQETLHPNHFTLMEVWKDEKSLGAHALAAHTRKFRTDLQLLIGSPYQTLVTTPMH
jgi:quinol monooxygenase YgiN